MKIGDEVYVHGYVDEIRKDAVIIKNEGGYFGTVADEIMPSAQPERKKGKWIEQDDGWDGVFYECSVCKDAFTLMDGTPSDNNYNFCPNCGADMRSKAREYLDYGKLIAKGIAQGLRGDSDDD